MRGYVDGGFTDDADLGAAVRAARRAADIGPWPRARDRAQVLRRAGFEVGAEPAGSATPDAYTILVPVGVVGLLEARGVVPALAAGNAVVLVASGATELAERLDTAELPSGAFNLVHGDELPTHADIDLIRPDSGPPVTLELDGMDEDEAVRVAGAAERVSLWTADVRRAQRVAQALAAEHVWINAPAADVSDAIERYCRRLTIYV